MITNFNWRSLFTKMPVPTTAAILDQEKLARDRIHHFFSGLMMYLAKAAFRDRPYLCRVVQGGRAANLRLCCNLANGNDPLV